MILKKPSVKPIKEITMLGVFIAGWLALGYYLLSGNTVTQTRSRKPEDKTRAEYTGSGSFPHPKYSDVRIEDVNKDEVADALISRPPNVPPFLIMVAPEFREEYDGRNEYGGRINGWNTKTEMTPEIRKELSDILRKQHDLQFMLDTGKALPKTEAQ